jgi:hypothetical protein
MESVKDLLKEIKDTTTQVSASAKDEVRVMKAMLNDRDYTVDVYGKNGKEGEYCPSKETRQVMASVISSAAKISGPEALSMMEAHEFKKSEAAGLVELSKEFTNTYISSGRKLPLGGRETSNVSLSSKHVEAGMRTYPTKKVGLNEDGTARCVSGEVYVDAYDSVRVHAPCPSWIKNKK